MIVVFLATFGAVFIAEIVGDKLLYTTSVLAARYRTLPIMLGMAPFDVESILGEPDQESKKKNPLMLLYRSLQLTFWRLTPTSTRLCAVAPTGC